VPAATNDQTETRLYNQEILFSTVKPENTKITITQEGALGSPVTITCNSEGHPEPNYTITHNGTTLSAGKMYTIPKVKWNDAGTYRCIAGNKLGSDLAFAYLTFHGKIRFLDTVSLSILSHACCAVRCGAVRCGAVRCGAVLRHACLQKLKMADISFLSIKIFVEVSKI
jgi:hypothetical protein